MKICSKFWSAGIRTACSGIPVIQGSFRFIQASAYHRHVYTPCSSRLWHHGVLQVDTTVFQKHITCNFGTELRRAPNRMVSLIKILRFWKWPLPFHTSYRPGQGYRSSPPSKCSVTSLLVNMLIYTNCSTCKFESWRWRHMYLRNVRTIPSDYMASHHSRQYSS